MLLETDPGHLRVFRRPPFCSGRTCIFVQERSRTVKSRRRRKNLDFDRPWTKILVPSPSISHPSTHNQLKLTAGPPGIVESASFHFILKDGSRFHIIWRSKGCDHSLVPCTQSMLQHTQLRSWHESVSYDVSWAASYSGQKKVLYERLVSTDVMSKQRSIKTIAIY